MSDTPPASPSRKRTPWWPGYIIAGFVLLIAGFAAQNVLLAIIGVIVATGSFVGYAIHGDG